MNCGEIKHGFIFGAGAEGINQFGICSGVKFKKSIILSKKVQDFAKYFLPEKVKIDNGQLLRWNSSNVLYQTIMEIGIEESLNHFQLNDNEIEIVRDYIKHREGEKKEDIYKQFLNLYNNKFYKPILRYGIKENNEDVEKRIEWFLDNIQPYAYIDALFNCLRRNDVYEKECSKIIKLYYSAAKIFCDEFSNIINPDKDVNYDEELHCADKDNFFEKLQQQAYDHFVNNRKEKTTLYYEIVKELGESLGKEKIGIVTTNYTDFVARMTGIDNIVHVHGKLDLYENIETKQVGKYSEVNKKPNDIVFPFLFVQSGVKPVVNAYQVEQLYKAVSIIKNADTLHILGYGLNNDDEHIINFLRARLDKKDEKRTVYYLYADGEEFSSKKEKIKNLLKYDNLEIVKTSEFIKIK